MNKKLFIYTFVDKNPEFLQLQIDSYKKYMSELNCEFIVINASIQYYSEMTNICDLNNIQVINYDGLKIHTPKYYVEQLNWFRDVIQSKVNENILLIHSDMFFINTLDFEKLLSNKKIYFNPQYRDTPFYKIDKGDFSVHYMWDGVILFDSEYINNNNLIEFFDWDYIYGITDVGGKTKTLLEKIDSKFLGYIEFWTYHQLNGNLLNSGLNGGSLFTFDIMDDKKRIHEGVQMGNRTFPYEDVYEDYNFYIGEKIMKIKEIFIDKFEFGNVVNSDFIQVQNEPIENSFLFHFKSGSQTYNKNQFDKLEKIRKLIFR